MRTGVLIAFLAGLGVGLSAACVAAIAWTSYQPASDLVQDLPAGSPADRTAASAAFDARIRARFPPGTPVRTLTAALDAQGFVPTWFESAGKYGAKRPQDDFPCLIVARVVWRATSNGKIAATSGSYGEEGCL